MRAFLVVCLVALAACGDSTGPVVTPPDDSIPTDLLPNEGLLRFTLATNCAQMTLAFGVDQFLLGPETLKPGESKDYRMGAGVHATSAKTFPVGSTTFPSQNVTVTAKQRVVRTLSCA